MLIEKISDVENSFRTLEMCDFSFNSFSRTSIFPSQLVLKTSEFQKDTCKTTSMHAVFIGTAFISVTVLFIIFAFTSLFAMNRIRDYEPDEG